MPDLTQESTPPAVAIPPVLDPAEWEDEPTFREVFMLHFSDPDANDTMRRLGNLLYSFVLQYWGEWPNHPEGLIRTQLRAAVADLRHAQGYLATLDKEADGLEPHEQHLCRVAGKVSREVGRQADRIDQELGSWRGEGVEP